MNLISKSLACILMAIGLSAQAQMTEITVPFSAGGPTSVFARGVEAYLLEKIGLQSAVVHRTGAAGVLGVRHAAQQPANGRNILVVSGGTFLYSRLIDPAFDVNVNDFELMAPMITMPLHFIVPANSTIQNWDDFILQARRRPVNCAISTTASRFAAQYIKSRLDLRFLEVVPYKGSADVATAVAGGHVDCAVDIVGPHYVRDRVRLIASTDSEAPAGIATISKSIPGFVSVSWFGVAMLRASPEPARRAVWDALREIHKDPKFQAQMATAGFSIRPPGAVSGNQFLEREFQFWTNVMKQNPRMIE